MTPSTRRRWFRWSLRTLFVIVAVSACAVWLTKDWLAPGDPEEWIPIADVGAESTAYAMYRLLAVNGIESTFEGSVTYGVSVRRRDAPRACKLIRTAGAKLGPYQNRIEDY